MCIPRVAPDASPCQPGAESAEQDRQTPVGSTLPGYPSARLPPEKRREERSNARDRTRARAFHSRQELERPLDLMPLGSTCPGSTPDRRAGHRYDAIALTPDQRHNARVLMRAAANCGRGHKAWTWWEGTPEDGDEVIGVTQTHCGTRACPSCDKKIRAHECQRVAGPWKMFLTFTLPRSICSAALAWTQVHLWQKCLIREMRRESARRFEEDKTKTLRGHRAFVKRRRIAKDRIEGDKKLEYAWVLEAHKDGYPHIHMCVNWSYVDYGFLRLVWKNILGAKYANVQGDKVYDVDGACRYLSKYVSKGGLSLDILAIIKGRRAWATTNKRGVKTVSEKVPLPGVSEEAATGMVSDPESCLAERGFSVSSSKPGCYAIWKRPATLSERSSIFSGTGSRARKEQDNAELDEIEYCWFRNRMDHSTIIEMWLEEVRARRSAAMLLTDT